MDDSWMNKEQKEYSTRHILVTGEYQQPVKEPDWNLK
jgi:hypothetical protein